MPKSEVTVSELVSIIGGKLHGDPNLVIEKFAALNNSCFKNATFSSSIFITNEITECSASLLILGEKVQEIHTTIERRTKNGLSTIVFENPYLFFARASAYILNKNRTLSCKIVIHPTAIVHDSVILKKGVQIGPGCVVEAQAIVGEFSVINALSFIGKNSVIGSNGYFHPRSTVLSNVIMGDNVILHSGSVIGSDGFGFVLNKQNIWEKIPQTGFVKIGNNVEIGSNTTIDKGTFEATKISSGAKLDNQVHVAHNVSIGENTVIAGCVGIAGSAKIGNKCQIGGAAGILGHLEICDSVIIGPMSLVLSNITKAGKYVGIYPLQTDRDWKKSSSIIKKLNSLRNKLFRAKNR